MLKSKVKRGWSQALFSSASCLDERQQAETGTEEVASEQQAALSMNNKAVAQAAQRLCSLLFGDLQEPPGHAPVTLLWVCCWGRGWAWWTHMALSTPRTQWFRKDWKWNKVEVQLDILTVVFLNKVDYFKTLVPFFSSTDIFFLT